MPDTRKTQAVRDAFSRVNAGNVTVWDESVDEQVQQALETVYDEARKHAHGCASENCTNTPRDYVRVTLSTMSGAMTVEVLLCDLCLATLEMLNHGQYMLLRR